MGLSIIKHDKPAKFFGYFPDAVYTAVYLFFFYSFSRTVPLSKSKIKYTVRLTDKFKRNHPYFYGRTRNTVRCAALPPHDERVSASQAPRSQYVF